MQTRAKQILTAIATAAAVTAFSASLHAGGLAVFSHKAHIANGAACPDCHVGKPEKGEKPTLNDGACKGCHDTPPPAHEVAGPARELAIAFPHKKHVDVGACVDCHQATADETQKAGAPLMEPERCFACHKENGIEIAAADCAKCHGVDKRGEMPAWHGADWGKIHGKRSAEGAFQKHGRACADCHGESSCMTCHQERKPMSHKLHVRERGAEDCSTCHEPVAGALPALKKTACADCHQGEPQATDIGQRAQPMHLKFPHGAHERAGQCVDCHKDTLEGTQKPNAPILTREQCDTCHQLRGVRVGDTQCARCHGAAEDRVRPKSHDQAWRSRHGREANWSDLEPHGAECSLCHAQRECVTCHLNMRPRDHTGLWRVRMHGIAASWDRDRCQQCHKTGACISCHRRTKPLYHRGAWGEAHGLAAKVKGPDKCTVCHDQAWCARCHAGS